MECAFLSLFFVMAITTAIMGKTNYYVQVKQYAKFFTDILRNWKDSGFISTGTFSVQNCGLFPDPCFTTGVSPKASGRSKLLNAFKKNESFFA